MKRIHITGTPIDKVSADEAALWVLARYKSGIRTKEAPVNAAIIAMAARDPIFQSSLKEFDLVIADGFWPALSATFLNKSRFPHANTSPFLKALFRNSSPNGLSVFLLGAQPELVEKAAKNLRNFHPNALVVGYRDGYFDLQEEGEIVNLINESEAKVLLIGISSPKKEYFIKRHWAQLNTPISIGVGGQFDIWAGNIKEAPSWIRKCGFEWFFRLCQEPKRLWERYSITNLRFTLLVLNQAFTMLFRGKR